MKEKNVGIELLRIISMFMVLLLHLNGQGGLLKSAPDCGMNYWVACLIQCASFCSVNCFAMISGYLMYDKKEKPSRIFNIYLQTLFYTVTIIGIFAVLKTQYRSLDMLLTALLPIMRKTYWYVTTYIGVCILMPILNKALHETEKKTMTVFLLTSFLFFSVLQTFLSSNVDSFSMKNGYSTLWLSWLYLLGGYIKKYDVVQKVRSGKAWATYVIAVVVTFASELIFVFGGKAIFGEPKMEGQLLRYTSPTIVVAAAALFIACAKIKLGKKTGKVVQIFGKAAFGVYLIHLCPPIWQTVVLGCAKDFASHNAVVMVGLMFLTAIVIYLLCSMIELARIGLFRLCRVDRLCKRLDVSLFKRIEKSKLLGDTSDKTECAQK